MVCKAQHCLSLPVTVPTHGITVKMALDDTNAASGTGSAQSKCHDDHLSSPSCTTPLLALKALLLPWPLFCSSYIPQIFYWEHSAPILPTDLYVSNSQPIQKNSTQTSLPQGSFLCLCRIDQAAFLCALIGLLDYVIALLGHNSSTNQSI